LRNKLFIEVGRGAEIVGVMLGVKRGTIGWLGYGCFLILFSSCNYSIYPKAGGPGTSRPITCLL